MKSTQQAAKKLVLHSYGHPEHGTLAPLEVPPSPLSLAHLVAQPRFDGMASEEAIEAALNLLHACKAAIGNDSCLWSEHKERIAKQEAIPQPPKFPASLEDFYRLIVKGRDKTNNQPRLRKFLARQIDDEEKQKTIALESTQQELNSVGKRIADMAAKKIALTPETGNQTIEEHADSLRNWIETSPPLLNAKERSMALEHRFKFFREEGFDSHSWLQASSEYITWWSEEKREQKRIGGLARAAKAHKVKQGKKKSKPDA